MLQNREGFNSYDFQRIIEAFSPARMDSFLNEANGNPEKALELYQWSQSMASAAWTIISHLEVLLRNAIDCELSTKYGDSCTRIPWFLRHDVLLPGDREVALKIMSGLSGLELTADQVIAHTWFGFWRRLFSDSYAKLWETCLYRVFRGDEKGNESDYKPCFPSRKDISRELEAVRKFRNRVAHHEPLIHVRIPLEINRLLSLARAISPEAATWMSNRIFWKELYAQRPVVVTDTVVIKSPTARDDFLQSLSACDVGVFVTNPGRFFRDVKYLGFYDGHLVYPEFPEIIEVRDDVECSRAVATRLERSSNRMDKKLGRVINWLLDNNRLLAAPNTMVPIKQIFLLSAFSGSQGRVLDAPIERTRTGRGSGFTRKGKRYVSMHQLENAETTSDF